MPLQHYIPAAFLANFSSSPSSPRRNSLISIGDKSTENCFTTSVSKVAAVQNLYKLFSLPPNFIDDAMGDYESDLIFTLNKLVNNELSAYLWAKVLVPFIAGFLVRGPDFNDRFKKRVENLKDFNIDEYEDITKKPFSDDINMGRYLERMKLIPSVMASKWILLETEGRESLIINDIGYIMMKGGYLSNGQYNDIGPAFPINQNHLLAIIPQKKRKVAVEKNGEWIPVIEKRKLILDNHTKFNELSAKYARRFIFGANEDTVSRYLAGAGKPIVESFPEPTHLGFQYSSSKSIIGHEWYKTIELLSKEPKSRGAWFVIDLNEI